MDSEATSFAIYVFDRPAHNPQAGGDRHLSAAARNTRMVGRLVAFRDAQWAESADAILSCSESRRQPWTGKPVGSTGLDERCGPIRYRIGDAVTER
jgi:hypothetical protein